MRFEETTGLSEILKKTELAMRHKIDVALAPLKMTSAQYQVLSCLEATPTLTNADLARRCSVTPQTMIRISQNLKRNGFVQEVSARAHANKIEMKLTKRGAKALCDAHVAVNLVELKSLAGFSEKKRAALQTALHNCFENLRSD